jgi:hypothetical protein
MKLLTILWTEEGGGGRGSEAKSEAEEKRSYCWNEMSSYV